MTRPRIEGDGVPLGWDSRRLSGASSRGRFRRRGFAQSTRKYIQWQRARHQGPPDCTGLGHGRRLQVRLVFPGEYRPACVKLMSMLYIIIQASIVHVPASEGKESPARSSSQSHQMASRDGDDERALRLTDADVEIIYHEDRYVWSVGKGVTGCCGGVGWANGCYIVAL